MTWLDSLPADLPAGRFVSPDGGDQPIFWLSDRPATPGQWSHWRARHTATGLWPVLISGADGAESPFALDAENRDLISEVDQHSGPTVLADWWRYLLEDDLQDGEADLGYLEPFSRPWPGVCPALPRQIGIEDVADQLADTLLGEQGQLCEAIHLGLIPAANGADAPTAIGWTGPLNHDNDTFLFSAVLRDWQQRFGALVVAMGADTLYLSVAAAPTTTEQALQVAAEHFAFCPDNIWQSNLNTVREYAEYIAGMNCWAFWWD